MHTVLTYSQIHLRLISKYNLRYAFCLHLLSNNCNKAQDYIFWRVFCKITNIVVRFCDIITLQIYMMYVIHIVHFLFFSKDLKFFKFVVNLFNIYYPSILCKYNYRTIKCILWCNTRTAAT